jgi:hypothetical protein
MPPHAWFNYIDHENRIRTRMITDSRGRVIVFMLQLETMIEDEWYPVIRYDSAHDEAHIDLIDPSGATYKKQWLDVREPYNAVFTLAENDLKTHFTEYRERFIRQLKGA